MKRGHPIKLGMTVSAYVYFLLYNEYKTKPLIRHFHDSGNLILKNMSLAEGRRGDL